MTNLLALLADGGKKTPKKLAALLACGDAELRQRLQQLQHQGINLCIDDQQVQLIPQLDLLNPLFLSAGLSPYQVHIQPVIDSTNQYILDNIQLFQKGDLCLAEYQSAGRGRRGRQWQSPFAGQMIASFYWTLPRDCNLNGVSLAIGLGVANALRKLNVPANVKWPNDILLFGRKLGGILVEMLNLNNGLINLVIGIGLNLSLPKQQDLIDQPWAELAEVLPQFNRNQIIVEVLQSIYAALQDFEQQGISPSFRQRWLELDAFFNASVNVIQEKQIFSGIAQGINEQGYLCVRQENGESLIFNVGDVSLRKKSP